MNMASPRDEAPLLQGLRVLDFGQGIAGPCCGTILRQQGAEVVKVEPPDGDWARNMGVAQGGVSSAFLAYNAGKRGICIDAATDEGRSVIHRLAHQADVVIQNFRPGVAERLGIGYCKLSGLNARLVQVSISGFGAEGPLADQPATDNVLQAMAGLMHANRDEQGVPRRVGIYLADIAAGLHAAQLVAAALYRRTVTGAGRHLQVSLYEACCAFQASQFAELSFATGGPAPRAATAPSGVFRASDGYVTLATLNDAMFARLCEALDLAELPHDPRFASNQVRLLHAEMLNAQVGRALAGATVVDACARLHGADVLHAPVRNHGEVMTDEQARHACLFGEAAAAGVTGVPLARQPGSALAKGTLYAPGLGEHTTEVLGTCGFSAGEIAALVRARAVRIPA